MINIAWVAGAALLGFLAAWLIRGTKIQSGQTTLETTTTSLKGLEKEKEAQQNTLDKLNAKHSQLTTEHKQLKKTLSTQETQLKDLEEQLRLAKNRPATTPQTVVEDNSYEIRALEAKVASLEKNIAFKEQELERLNDENENLATRIEVAEAAIEEAQEAKDKALQELKQYESYRPRFEEANLERNAIKYKYEQLLVSQNSSADIVGQLEQDKAALTQEVATLKNSLNATFEQRDELKAQLSQEIQQQQKRNRGYNDLQLKYDTLLRLQERTEAKLKALEVSPE